MDLTAVKAGAYTHHLALTSPDPAKLAAYYADTLDMAATQRAGDWLVSGPGRRLLLTHGPARGLGHVGMGVRDAAALADLKARAEAEGLEPQAFAGDLLGEDAFALHDPDGNKVVFGLPRSEPDVSGLRGPLQHVTFATRDVTRFERFYADRLGFAVSDYVVRGDGKVTTVFLRSNHEHHTFGVFLQDREGVDHFSFEAGEWGVLKDWCDRFADRRIRIDWGPGRHGPGNNLFAFITDPDGNWVELSAELEVIHGRAAARWPPEERTLNLWGPGRLRV